ncbi:hypothetical protein BJ742DRAFT_530776 [Cladochytrium replicatum]|nr:hypothetical protein BJ742DRAFT_530776 [Cladochytrium replicatum]
MRICKAPPTLWDLAANITIVKDFLVDFVGYKLPNINWPQFLFQTLESLHLMSPELFAMCDVMRDVMFAFYSDSITESDVGMAVAMAMGVKLMYGLGYNNVASDEAKETDKEFLDVPCISESLAHLASSMKPRTMSKNDFEALKNYLKLAIANSALAGKEHRHRVEIFQHFIGNQESTAESAQLIESNASTPDDQSTPSFSRVHPGLTSAYWVSYNPNDVPSGYHPLYAYFLHHLACQLLMDVFKLQKEVSKCERSLAALWPDGTNVQLPAQPKVLKDRLNRETGWREYAVLLVGAEKSVWISSLDMVRDHTAALDEYQYQKARKQVSTYKAARPWRPKRARVEPEQREEGEEEAEGNGRGTSAEDMDIDDRESTSDD